MPTFKLNRLLIGLVVLSGLVALLLSTSFILYRLNQETNLRLQQAAGNARHQFAIQLNRGVVRGALAASSYPDFHLWKRSDSHRGLCLAYKNLDKETVRSVCLDDQSEAIWPSWFAFFYTATFKPLQEVTQPLIYDDAIEGYVEVTASKDVLLTAAWQSFQQLFELALLIIIVLCVLLFLTLHIALRPARILQEALVNIQHKGLTKRAPHFVIEEWQMIAEAINSLVENLEQTLNERQRLSLKLVTLQEEERRYLCRELHDELGQSLAGLSAVTRYINQEAQKKHPQLLASTEQIYQISQHMMQLVKQLMIHLRPADFDELGLAESLRSYIDEWNQKHHDIHCSLNIDGELETIPDTIAMNALRIIQECLTNISKHAGATRAEVSLNHPTAPDTQLMLSILDNGKLRNTDFIDQTGKGLMGIRERVFALDGELQLETATHGGLNVKVTIPLPAGNH